MNKMTEFSNVTVVKKANVYFDGKVSSRTIRFADGSLKTLGYILPGEFTFNTQAPELMEILAGEADVLLAGADSWLTVLAGQSFEVAANSAFTIKVSNGCDYCCSFL